MNCQDFRELIDSYLCDELLTETNHGVLSHLEKCPDCRNVTEQRRIFRARLRTSVQNCEEYRICEKFNARMENSLRQSLLRTPEKRKYFIFSGFSFAAAAVGLLLIAVFGVWILQTADRSPEFVRNDGLKRSSEFQKVALGDHQNCAVTHNLTENAVKIDLASPQYANLKEAVLTPLKEKFNSCELVKSHICKYDGQTFTHLVFDYDGKILSVLMTELNGYQGMDREYIAKVEEQGYQIAHFDIDEKAVFVISNMAERENSMAAEALTKPLLRQITDNRQAAFVSFADFRR